MDGEGVGGIGTSENQDIGDIGRSEKPGGGEIARLEDREIETAGIGDQEIGKWRHRDTLEIETSEIW